MLLAPPPLHKYESYLFNSIMCLINCPVAIIVRVCDIKIVCATEQAKVKGGLQPAYYHKNPALYGSTDVLVRLKPPKLFLTVRFFGSCVVEDFL